MKEIIQSRYFEWPGFQLTCNKNFTSNEHIMLRTIYTYSVANL